MKLDKGCPLGEKKTIKFFISAAPIRLHSDNFAFKEMLNKSLKLMKKLKHFKFCAKEVNPCEFAVIINETHIILFTTKRVNYKTPNIRVN